jgi:hypothetical protein
MSLVRRLYNAGFGLTTGFIKHSYNMWLHFTVPCNTHSLIFLVLVRSHVLSPLSVVASSAESLLFTANPEDFGSNSATTSYGIPWHPLPSLTSLTDNWLCWLQLTSYIAWEQTTKKTRLPPLLGGRLGSDHIENMSRGVCLATIVNTFTS